MAARGSVRGSGSPADGAAPYRSVPVSFSDLPGWERDDHRAALAAFRSSCAVLSGAWARERDGVALDGVCEAMAGIAAEPTRTEARAFFETQFEPFRIEGADGLLTGYYEPVLRGSRERGPEFCVPILRRPADLVNLTDENLRASGATALTHAQRTAGGLQPYPTRTEIEEGALDGRGLELVFLADPVDAFFLHVQGSGCIELAEGGRMRMGYDGKNGHPYTSIGRYLVETGAMPLARVTLGTLRRYLRADPVHARAVMRQNASYVFFRELTGAQAAGPVGARSIPLTTGRSLAVDASIHALGMPIYVAAPDLKHANRSAAKDGFRRLMVAHDVGSAIRGPARGDVYFGSGERAGTIAGRTRHRVTFYVLRPTAGAGAMGAGLRTAQSIARRR